MKRNSVMLTTIDSPESITKNLRSRSRIPSRIKKATENIKEAQSFLAEQKYLYQT